MASEHSTRFVTLLRREMQEYKASLFWTPVVIAGALIFFMLLSVLLSDRITVLGDALMNVMMQEESASGLSIRISIEDDDGMPSIELGEQTDGSASNNDTQTWTIEENPAPLNESEWNFSREWQFAPKPESDVEGDDVEGIQSFNPVLNILYYLLMLVLFLVTYNYLLGSLFADRKDRSILFWKSMPVSEWEVVLSKMVVALAIAPAIYIAVAMLLQLAYILLGLLLVYRMDMSPTEVILDKIEIGPLVLNQIGGWVLTALWVAPLYAWLLLASAAARRSPFLLAIAPVLALVIIEELFFGGSFVSNMIYQHLPHYESEGSAVGFYFEGIRWAQQDWLSLCLGLVVTAGLLTAAVYLRRYRFEV